jgi:hypothetical protein
MQPSSGASPITRRTALKALAAGTLAAAFPQSTRAQFDPHAEDPPFAPALLAYLQRLARPDGGYAWEDQDESHLTPTFAVIGCYHLLEQTPPDKLRLAHFVRAHHPGSRKKLEQEHREFEYQQIQSLLWLGEDASPFADQVRTWRTPTAYLKQYERHSNPILRHESAAFVCRALLGLPTDDLLPAYVPYLDQRRRPTGSFNNTPAADGTDGNILNTWYGLEALHALGRSHERKDQTVAWLRACQLPTGGFTRSPKPDYAGTDDVAYTRAALRALKLLGSTPADPASCLQYLHRLWNADGGFADRPGWLSNPLATYYALDALDSLAAFSSPPRSPAPSPAIPPLPPNLKVFSIQIEAHGQGSPAEAVELARSLAISLWGAKNATPDWIARAQALADQCSVPVTFFPANEEYGTWVTYPGFGTYSHTSDVIAPPGGSFGPSLAGQTAVPYAEFRQRRLDPLTAANGRLVWQFGENEPLVRTLLDDSLERGGYAAISTFHFGNPDFTRSEPFLKRYQGQIPFVALQDAHGKEPWWFADMTTGFRTLFLATEPTWDGWLNALKCNWVVPVRHDAVSNFKTWTHAGSRQVLNFVRERELDWRWWDNPRIARPLVSLVAVSHADPFEAHRSETGLTLRVRCAWQNTNQGLPKSPLAELKKLTVDDVEVAPTLIAPKRGTAYTDYAHLHHIPNPTPGPHRATATIQELATGKQSTHTLTFTAASNS